MPTDFWDWHVDYHNDHPELGQAFMQCDYPVCKGYSDAEGEFKSKLDKISEEDE